MSSPFSWADRVNIAVNTCLPCLQRAYSADSLSSPRLNSPLGTAGLGTEPNDDLRHLLVDSDSDALSLHSNIGNSSDSRVRRKATGKKANSGSGGGGWRLTLFGYHLFGRPPIHLPTSPDDNDSLYNASNSRYSTATHHDFPQQRGSISAPGSVTRTTTLHSTATFDSDAAPLDVDTIDSLSGTTAADLALAEEEERRAKEERRKRRRERREMKKMARALAAQASVGGQFEGFQGSGGAPQWPTIPQALTHEPAEATSEADSRTVEERMPSPTRLLPHLAMKEEDEDEGADLDGLTYARRRRPPPSAYQRSRSDSRSRTSSTSTSITKLDPSSKPKKGRSSKTKSSQQSKSTLSSNDSTSLASPTSPGFNFLPHEGGCTSITTLISPTTLEQGQGFFDYDNDTQGAPLSSYTQQVNEGFPSTGFGVRVGAGKRGSAFLAKTGLATEQRLVNDPEDRDGAFDGTF